MSSKEESTKSSEKSQSGDTKLLFMMLGGMTVEIGIVVGLLGVTGVLNFSGTDEAAKIVVAVIALVGTLIGTTVTIIGLMFKRSMDARNFNLKSEAEERLKLDTAIKAVELFKGASDSKSSTSSAESAGALFALSSLGQSHFAISLLDELWPKDLIATPSAVWVINNSLKSTESGAAEVAANSLRANCDRLLDGSGNKWWPTDFVFELPNELSDYARLAIQNARIRSMLSADYDYWDQSSLNVDFVALTYTFREDSSPGIRQSAAAFLSMLLQTYNPNDGYVMNLPSGHLAIEEVRAEIKEAYGSSFRAISDQSQNLVEQLDKWVKRAPYFEKLRAAAEESASES